MNPLDPALLPQKAAPAPTTGKLTLLGVAGRLGYNLRDGMNLCPFHDDKNPSLSVDDAKGVFKCFGCDKQGGIVGFVMAARNVDKHEAGRILASWEERPTQRKRRTPPAPTPEPRPSHPSRPTTTPGRSSKTRRSSTSSTSNSTRTSSRSTRRGAPSSSSASGGCHGERRPE